MKEDTMWVPQRLAEALSKEGLGIAIKIFLERVVALRKSATSHDKPTAIEHYNSLHVRTQKTLSEPKEILLIDDIVTRGATILGAANRLKEAFPKSSIRAFAAMRTMTPPYAYFKSIYDPCEGNIETQDDGQNTLRKP
jgi:predicted amidophosphoribosyltransferase